MSQPAGQSSPRRRVFERALFMFCLVVAGEAIFGLPFHVVRFFRPVLLDVMGLTNTDIGLAFSAYGVVAMISYAPGGPLADRFSARRLMTASLFATAAGGLLLLHSANLATLRLLYGFWGLTTILLFWAALIRATREWGGDDEQGAAFGILDSGRGVLAAVIASTAVLAFESFLPEDPDLATLEQRRRALESIILIYTATTAGAGLLVWLFVPDSSAESGGGGGHRIRLADVRHVLGLPTLWFQAIIVICAYVGYKGVDVYAIYAVDAWDMNEVEAARLATIAAWVRPFAALGAGVLADKLRGTVVVGGAFASLVLAYLVFALYTPAPSAAWLLYLDVTITCVAIYGLRGVYFALFEDAAVPTAYTGTAVGVVSVIGYTPDIFIGPLSGWLIDRSPGAPGYQHFFGVLAAFSAVGFGATLAFSYFAARARRAA